jgi:hypothetical protein
VRIDAQARRPADGLRRVADPIVFAVATQLITHAVWKAYALPEAGLSFVIELACSSFTLSRVTAIARLARLYRVTADVDVSRRVTGFSRGTSAWAIASAPTPTYADAATSLARPLRRQPAVRRRRCRPEEGEGSDTVFVGEASRLFIRLPASRLDPPPPRGRAGR